MTVIAKTAPLTTEQQASIRKELAAILAGPSFSGSKRCSDFLDYVVGHALEGDFEHLAERFLGVELFGRPVSYETATDSVVRVRATDVRHRLAQHYAKSAPVSGVRIDLPSGSYAPEFNWLAEPVISQSHPAADEQRPKWILLCTVALLLVAGIWAGILRWKVLNDPDRIVNEFWQPVIANKRPVIFRFGHTISYWITPEVRRKVESGQPNFSVEQGQIIESWDDFASAGSIRSVLLISDLLNRHGVATRLRWPQEIQESEVANSNVIYVGAFNNSWTVSLNQDFRFTFEEADSADGHIWMIRDRKNPDRKWSMTKTYPQPIDHDYALITRAFDAAHNRVIISIGGLNQFGSQAAAEFLTDESALGAFARSAPKGWEKQNIQIVLEMEVSDNRPVNPKVAAFNVW